MTVRIVNKMTGNILAICSEEAAHDRIRDMPSWVRWLYVVRP